MFVVLKGKDHIPNSMDQLFDDDDLGLLADVKIKSSKTNNQQETKGLDEVLSFIDAHGEVPKKSDKRSEMSLYLRYQHWIEQNNSKAIESCSEHLISYQNSHKPKDNFESFDDLLNDDDLGLLDGVTPDKDLFKESKSRNELSVDKDSFNRFDDTMARAIPCQNFAQFKPLLELAKDGLKNGDLIYQKSSISSINDMNIGGILQINGQLAIISDVHAYQDKREKDTRFRVTLIYVNGTQSSPLNTSIRRLFDKDINYVISDATIKGQEILLAIENELREIKASHIDNKNVDGYIYILQSKSTNPVLTQFVQNSSLVKVGFCTTSVEKRIANAEHEPTYLEGKVELIKSYSCTGIDPHKLEHIVHAFLSEHRLNVTLIGTDKKKYHPREWFTVTPQVAAEVVERIIDRSITSYRLDSISGRLVKISS